MRYVDANIFVRLLARDDPAMTAASADWFLRLESGEEEATTSETTITEVVFVLSSKALYNMPRQEIVDRLTTIIALPMLRTDYRQTLLNALDLYVRHAHMSFPDVLAVAHMERQGITEIVSYDRDFDRVPGITRVEP